MIHGYVVTFACTHHPGKWNAPASKQGPTFAQLRAAWWLSSRAAAWYRLLLATWRRRHHGRGRVPRATAPHRGALLCTENPIGPAASRRAGCHGTAAWVVRRSGNSKGRVVWEEGGEVILPRSAQLPCPCVCDREVGTTSVTTTMHRCATPMRSRLARALDSTEQRRQSRGWDKII